LVITLLYFFYFAFYVTHDSAMDIAIDTASYLIIDTVIDNALYLIPDTAIE